MYGYIMHVLYVHGMYTWMCICAYANRLLASRLAFPHTLQPRAQGDSGPLRREWDPGPARYILNPGPHTHCPRQLLGLAQSAVLVPGGSPQAPWCRLNLGLTQNCKHWHPWLPNTWLSLPLAQYLATPCVESRKGQATIHRATQTEVPHISSGFLSP